jgi:tetratricopeptide (TPR) repeat protein
MLAPAGSTGSPAHAGLLGKRGVVDGSPAHAGSDPLLRPLQIWYNIGCALERQNRSAEARRGYQRAIAADPAYPDPIYNLGMLALDDEAYDDAIIWLERYLSLDPCSGWAAKARKGLMLARLSLSAAAAGRE